MADSQAQLMADFTAKNPGGEIKFLDNKIFNEFRGIRDAGVATLRREALPRGI